MVSFVDKIKALIRITVIQHSIFALPIAYTSYIFAVKISNQHFNILLILHIAFIIITIRSFSMIVNRIIDRKYDKLNSRTNKRDLATNNIISTKEAIIGSIIFLIIYIILIFYLYLPLKYFLLSICPILLSILYPYAKRFTHYAHFILGIIQATAPIGVWIIINQSNYQFSILLGLFIGLWIAGFDILYSCQDYEHDIQYNLKSIPTKFGIKKALTISKISHLLSCISLILFSISIIHTLNIIWWIGLIIYILLLIWQHAIISYNNLSKINTAFFTTNGLISMSIFIAALLTTIF